MTDSILTDKRRFEAKHLERWHASWYSADFDVYVWYSVTTAERHGGTFYRIMYVDMGTLKDQTTRRPVVHSMLSADLDRIQVPPFDIKETFSTANDDEEFPVFVHDI